MNCAHTGCDAPATHCVRICVPAQSWPIDMHQPLQVMLGLRLCHTHACALDVDEMLAGAESSLRKVFEIMTRGRCPPDFDRAFVEAVDMAQFDSFVARKN